MGDMTSEWDLTDRLWRARRRHDHIDAVLRQEGTTWQLRFFRNDRLFLTWPYLDRTTAVAEAHRRLRELQRAGWTAHW
jgi:hypothetical protein